VGQDTVPVPLVAQADTLPLRMQQGGVIGWQWVTGKEGYRVIVTYTTRFNSRFACACVRLPMTNATT
jgi:hypothetical protein